MKALRLYAAAAALLLCASLFSCGNSPAETGAESDSRERETGISETQPPETSFANIESTKENVQQSEDETSSADETNKLQREVPVRSGLLWMLEKANRYTEPPTATVQMQLPNGWIQSPDFERAYCCEDNEKRSIILREVYEVPDNLPISAYAGRDDFRFIKTGEISSGENLLIEIYQPDTDFPQFYDYDCYIRLDKNYILKVNCSSDTPSEDFSDILQSMSMLPVPADTGAQQKSESEKFEWKTITLNNLVAIDHQAMYESSQTALPDSVYIELQLPNVWSELIEKNGVSSAPVFAENQASLLGICPDFCKYQCFYSRSLYFADAFEEELNFTELSENGYSYSLKKSSLPVYHATEYYCNMRIADELIYSFYICADADDEALAQRIINSVRFCK